MLGRKFARIEARSLEKFARVSIRMAPAGECPPHGCDGILHARANACSANVFEDCDSPARPQDALRTSECMRWIGYRTENERKDDNIDALWWERRECFVACDSKFD